MYRFKNYILPGFLLLFIACGPPVEEKSLTEETTAKFQFKADRFADLQLLRYQVPGFDDLNLQKKKLVYYLYEAALSGRDIIYDQNYKHNLRIRRALEAIVDGYQGDRSTPEFEKFLTYTKRVWFSNGIHHHYSFYKIPPEFSRDYWDQLVANSESDRFPLVEGEDKTQLAENLASIVFDLDKDAKRLNQDQGVDNISASANNYYEGVTQAEVEDFYSNLIDPNNPRGVSYGLNSKLIKDDDQVTERTYKIGGLYGPALEKIVYWLELAIPAAENDLQRSALEKLVEYYKTGDLKTFDDYNIAWVKDTASMVDAINGFIEVYGDAMGYRGAFESVVSINDVEASKRMSALQNNVQWFEENSPIMEPHKKKEVKGISYKVVTVVVESGDAAPSTPVGINLPNSSWIRAEHGSKAVSLGNIKDAYNQAASGSADEFAYTQEEKDRAKEYGVLASSLHTALHEVIGHASGQLEPDIINPSSYLKQYFSPIEEARADLVSLYYIMDPKMVEIGVMPSLDAGKALYESYIRNGLMLQLRRLNEGENIEQAHMRNRQTVSSWVLEKGMEDVENKVIERITENGKTYFVINDYKKLRSLFGELLREVQRIKSQGDFEAAKTLIETYGVKVDQEMLMEVKQRYATLDYSPYSGFIQPKLIPVMEGDEIVDVKVEYPNDFVAQMMEYGEKYSFLPHNN
ncbi:MAG: dihydrofolate reductase [Bacteroidetes bacterium]|nr:dihydrofolate reductase [Bacteroidota bacterium]